MMYYTLKKYRYLIWLSMFVAASMTKAFSLAGSTLQSFSDGVLVAFFGIAIPIWLYDCIKQRRLVWYIEDDD